jgi:hypothetical protein
MAKVDEFGLFEASPEWGYLRGDVSSRARVENRDFTNIVSSASAAPYLRATRRGMLAFSSDRKLPAFD